MLLRFDPFRELDRLTDEVTGRSSRLMPMDAYRRGGHVVAHLDLPGVRAEDLDITVERNVLTVTAHREVVDVVVGTEPGEFLAKESAVHLAEVVSVEDRDGTTFVGLDTGWSVMNEHFVYKIPFHPVLCRAADAEPVANVTVSGHINEGNDLFAEDHPMPEVEEGDIVAIPNVGSYNASMVSVHCLRPEPPSVFFTDRL